MRAYSFYARARALRIESLIDTRITSMRLGSNDTNKCTLGIAYFSVYHTETNALAASNSNNRSRGYAGRSY